MKRLIKKILHKLIDGYFVAQRESIKDIYGNNVQLQTPFYFSNLQNIKFGKNVTLAAFVHIWAEGGVEIGDNVMIASHTAITSATHNPKIKQFNKENIFKKVVIGNNVWIGSHVVIFPGVQIGNNCIIGAGSIVNKDIPDNCVYAGVPAKKLYELDQFEIL
ncbi:MAG: acyltransferase [Bacteroidales bacterium]|nr:acyltransferase [Bacteroidales bacterium]